MQRTSHLGFACLAFVLVAACGGGGSSDEGATTGQGAGGGSSGTSGAAGSNTSGSGTAGKGTSGSGTSGSGTAGSGTAGSGTSGSGTAGSGTSGSGTSGSGTAGKGTSGSGTSGSGTAGSGTAGSGVAGSGTAGSAGGTQVLRFVALGDTGKGNDSQKAVAAAMAAQCAKAGCDFAVLLGDNFYDTGVSSTTDGQWKTKFEDVYASVPVPFYAVLGNHDYGGNGAGWEPAKAQNEVDYAKTSSKWIMPAKHYTFGAGPVDFFALDTNEQMFGFDAQQKANVKGWIQASKAPWKIALGHHPYYSNGPHGNAGTYEGIPFVPVVSGGNVKSFFDDAVCGKVDVYLCGHDHSKQWIGKTCSGTELVVSGAGSATTDLDDKNPAHFQNTEVGFLYVVVDDKSFTGTFFDSTGKEEFTRTVTK